MQTSSLLLTVPYDASTPPPVAADATSQERRDACERYWAESPFAYTPGPLTITQPIHGATMGPVYYATAIPQASYDGIYLTTLYDLDDLQEFWLTVESVPPDQVDPLRRGPTYVQGYRAERGRGYINFDLASDSAVNGSLLVVESRGSF